MDDRVVLHVLPHPGGGGERYVDMLARMQGFRFEKRFMTTGQGKLEALAAVPRLRREASAVDLVHVHGDAAALLCLPLLGRRPSVITFHGLHLYRRSRGLRRALVGRGLRAAIARSRAVICLAESELADAREAVGPRAAGLVLIENGIDLGPAPSPADREAARAELGLPDEAVAVLFVGQLEPLKDPLGFCAAVHAAAAAAGPPVIGLVAGAGSLAADVERQAGDDLRLLGQRDDVPRLLAAADVFVLPSEREGLSLALLEAMAARLPAIVSDGPGNPEAVGEAGVVCPFGDRGAFADALVRLAGDAGLRRRLGEAARARVAQRFSAERMVEETRGVYERVRDGEPAPGR